MALIYTLIGLVLIIMIMIVIILNIRSLLGSYKDTKNVSTLYFATAFLFFLVAIVFLLIEKIALTIHSGNPSILIGLVSGWTALIALIASGGAIICINLFAFHNTFPERKKILAPIIGILTGLYVFLLCYSIFGAMHLGGTWAAIEAGEMTYNPIISAWSFVFLIPCAVSGPVVFYYFSSMTKNTNAPNSKRSFWMGFAITLFFIGYVLEILPVQNPSLADLLEILSIVGRVSMFSAAYILYVCFTMPEWFKTRIGWTE